MANQIQALVYQIDGSPLSSPIIVAFLTSNIYIREYQTNLIPQINAAIVYYPNTSNQLQEQTFLVSESASTLIAAANVNGTTQVSTTVLEINQDPQIPGGLIFSFPAQGISIWPVAVPVVGGVNSFLEFKNKKYYLLEDEDTLVTAANAGGGGGVPTLEAVLAQGNTAANIIELNTANNFTNTLYDNDILLRYNDGIAQTLINLQSSDTSPVILIKDFEDFRSELTALGINFNNVNNYSGILLTLFTEVSNNSIGIGDFLKENFINVFGQVNNERISFVSKTPRYNFNNVPTYFDNAAALAAGLIVGDIYRRTAGGDSDILCIVH